MSLNENNREGVGTSKITSSKGQNIESLINLIRTSKVKRSERRKSNLSDFQIVNYLWRKYLWRFGVNFKS